MRTCDLESIADARRRAEVLRDGYRMTGSCNVPASLHDFCHLARRAEDCLARYLKGE